MATAKNTSLKDNGWIPPPDNTGSQWSPPIFRTANFSSGVVGQPAIGEDAFDSSQVTERCTYSDEQALTGSTSGKITWLTSGSSDGGGVLIRGDKTKRYYRGTTLWFQVHCYFPSGYVYTSGGTGTKFLRIHTYNADGSNSGYNDIYFAGFTKPDAAFYSTYEGVDPRIENNIGDRLTDLPTPDTWESWQFAVTLDTVPKDSGGMAQMLFWRNNTLLSKVTNRRTLGQIDDYAADVHLNTFWNDGVPQDQSFYADGITVTNQEPSFTDAQGNPLIEDLV